jgi:hypothetical protein
VKETTMSTTTTPMTRDQAHKQFHAAMRARGGSEWAEFDSTGSGDMEMSAWEVDRAVKQLDELIAKGEEVERASILLRLIGRHAQLAVKRVPMLKKMIGVIDELGRDPELFDHMHDAMDSMSKHVGKYIERGRNAAQIARDAILRGEAYLARQRKGSEAAEESWATALMDLERLCTEAAAEGKRWATWTADACAAAKARDTARLAMLRKAPPPGAALDAIAALPRDRPFTAFEREFKMADLPKPLQDAIRRDIAKIWPKFGQAQAVAIHRAMLRKQVDGLAVEPPDARKALALLKLPAAALAALRNALAEPAGRIEKAIEAVARKHGVAGSGRQFVATLAKAGLL